MNGKTLPALATQWGESVDELRVLLRRQPDLAALAVKIGAVRAFSPLAGKRIREALAKSKG